MIPLTTIINISVATAPTGLKNFNINNVALFTNETVIGVSYSATFRVYVSAAAVATDFGSSSETYQQAIALFSQSPNILAGGGSLIVIPFVPGDSSSILTAVARTYTDVFYCGILSTVYPAAENMKALADAIQAYGDKILFLPSYDTTLINAGGVTNGKFGLIQAASDYATRCLIFATGTTSGLPVRLFAAAYAGRCMSVNFTGSNTALTANLKQLATVTADETITSDVLTAAITVGVDTYPDIAGIGQVYSTGANKFFDEVYNQMWLVAALKVAGYNALAQVSNKIPQTEQGMTLLKKAYQNVLDQAVSNGYVAPGSWTSAEWFGNQTAMARNIEERGYYIYSAPVSQQSAADRADREAPLIQIAIKEAGAIHSSTVVINVNP